MNKFVIVADSCCDLNGQIRSRYGIEYLPMHLIYDGKQVPADLDWKYIAAKDFYAMMRAGTRFTTSQINKEDYKDAFESYIRQGYDVLSVSCSSALSSSYKGSLVARDELLAKYPQAKIYCIDGLNACIGLGFLCIAASALRAQGYTAAQTAEYLEAHKLEMHQVCVADDLTYLKRAGRVSATSAFFGGIFKIKPVIISDANGQNVAVEKVKGRLASINKIVEMFQSEYRPHAHQRIGIVHADCPEDAELLRQRIAAVLPDGDTDIVVDYIGPIVGASVGPGALAVFFFGDEVTYKA